MLARGNCQSQLSIRPAESIPPRPASLCGSKTVTGESRWPRGLRARGFACVGRESARRACPGFAMRVYDRWTDARARRRLIGRARGAAASASAATPIALDAADNGEPPLIAFDPVSAATLSPGSDPRQRHRPLRPSGRCRRLRGWRARTADRLRFTGSAAPIIGGLVVMPGGKAVVIGATAQGGLAVSRGSPRLEAPPSCLSDRACRTAASRSAPSRSSTPQATPSPSTTPMSACWTTTATSSATPRSPAPSLLKSRLQTATRPAHPESFRVSHWTLTDLRSLPSPRLRPHPWAPTSWSASGTTSLARTKPCRGV